MERDEPSSSKTVTITRPRNGKAKPIRLNNKTKADAYNKIKKRESEMSYSSITDVKGRRVQTTHAVEDKSNKNQQDVAHSHSQQNSLSKDRQAIMITELIRIKSQATYVIPAFLMTVFKDQHRGGFTSSFEEIYCINPELFSGLDASTDQRLQTTPEVEDKSNKNQQDVAYLLSNQHAILMMSTERFNMISQKTSLLQNDIKLLQEESSKMKSSSENKKYCILHKTLYEKLKATVIWNRRLADDVDSISPHISMTDSLHFYLLGGADASDNKLEYNESKISFIYSSNLIVDVGFKKRLHTDMYLAEDSTICMERVKAFGKAYDAALFDEFEKSILNVGNDKITKQRSGKKEKIKWLNKVITKKIQLASQSLKEVVQRENYFQKENQLTEQEKTEQVNQLTELHILKERESEDEEKVKAELPADNIVFHRTKVRNAKSKMNTSSLYRAYNLYRKNVLERELLSLEQLREALDSLKSPHYIWPSGHPLILSKERQIEPDFSSNEHMERLHSFVNGTNRRHRTWNSDQIVRPEPMVSAGFSYDGEDDKVVCKSCGAISDVNDWSDDDEDYAFTMHRRTGSSHCEFLRKFDPRRSNM